MINIKYIFPILLLGLIISTQSCNSDKSQPGNSTERPSESTAEVADTPQLPDLSVYNLPSEWKNQDNETVRLEDYRGSVVVLTMIYTSCKLSCPRLVSDVRRIHNEVGKKANKYTKYIFVTIDPEVDTPDRLKEFSEENLMTDPEWVFLTGDKEETRSFAAVLGVSYKRSSPIDFAHSNIISVFDKDGVLAYQKDGLGADISPVVKEIAAF